MSYTPGTVTSIQQLNTELTKISNALADTLQRKPKDGNFMDTDLDMNSKRILNLPDPISETEPARVKDVAEIASAAQGKKIVRNSTEGFPEVGSFPEGTELKFYDTLDEYVLIRSETGALQWVEEGNVGDEVDVTAASHLTLAQARASDLKVGQLVILKERGDVVWEVVVGKTPNGFDIIDLQDGTHQLYFDALSLEKVHINYFTSPDERKQSIGAAMQRAHSFGRDVHYSDGYHVFDTLTIPSGGIVGESKRTYFITTNTGTANIITHECRDWGNYPAGVTFPTLVNENGFNFDTFTLTVSTGDINQKPSGYGIWCKPAQVDTENYHGKVNGVTVRNLPSCLGTSLCSFMTIKNNYFSLYKDFGVYIDMDNDLFEDNGDNSLESNTFFTNKLIGPSSISLKYRAGGLRASLNKINGGMIGADISPLKSSSVIVFDGNSVENQTINCLRYIDEIDSTATAFGRFVVSDCQLNGTQCEGSVISMSSGLDYTNREVVLADNQIAKAQLTGVAANAIDFRGINRFYIGGGSVYGNGTAAHAVFCDGACSDGNIGDFFADGFNVVRTVKLDGSNISNSFITYTGVFENEPISAIAAGASIEIAKGVSNTSLGDKVTVTFEGDVLALQVTAHVYAENAIKIRVFNAGTTTFNATQLKMTVEITGASK